MDYFSPSRGKRPHDFNMQSTEDKSLPEEDAAILRQE